MTKAGQAARSPWFIFAIALATRLAIMLALYTSPELPLSAFWGTGLELGNVSSSLVKTGELRSPFGVDSGPTAIMTPMYPVIVASIFKAFGVMTDRAAWAVLTLQAVFSSLVCLIIYATARLSFGETAAVWGAWLWALCPHTQFMPLFRFWESSLSALLVACVFFLILRMRSENGTLYGLRLGALVGIAALNNPALLPFVMVMLFWMSLERAQQALLWRRQMFVTIVTLIAVMLPWTMRNYQVFHRVIPVRDNFGLELWTGNHQGGIGKQDVGVHPSTNTAEAARFLAMGETAYMDEKKSEAVTFIRTHPAIVVRESAIRIVDFWTGWDAFGLSRTTLPIFAFALWQLIVLVRRKMAEAVFYALPLLLYPLPYYITHADIRFRYSIEPIVFVLAGAAAAQVMARIRERKAVPKAVAVSA